MPKGTKIATCCYCGTRAALRLDGGRHELVCSHCGAPLHDMKMLRADAVDKKAHTPRGKKPVRGAFGGIDPEKMLKAQLKSRKKKKRKGFLSEAFDLLEDIFD